MNGNVEIVRAAVAAYEAEDGDALLTLVHPEAELHEWPEGPDSRVYQGLEVGDRVFVFIRSLGKGRGSSIEVELDTFGGYTIRNSKLTRVPYFTDREAALAAAGLTEEQIRQEAT